MILHRLDEVAAIFNGKTPSKIEQRCVGHPVLKIKDVTELGIYRGSFESFVDIELATKHATRWIEVGDTLILNAAHNADYVASKMFFAGADVQGALPTGEWLLVRPNNPLVLPSYANYWLRSAPARKAIKFLVKGIHLYPKDVGSLKIPLVSLKEQQRVVDLLSRAEGIVRLCREAQKKAAEIIPALFLDMFGDPAANPKGWSVVRLGDLAEKMSDGPFGSNLKTSHYVEEGIRVIRLNNIGVGYLNDEDHAFVSPEHFASLPRHRCLPGDVIVGTLGDPNLRAFVLPPSIPEALNKADCVQFRCLQDAVCAEYICWLMNMPSTLMMAASLVQGITRTRISMGRLRELMVPVPPLALQQKFGNRVEQSRSVQSLQETSAQEAATTFNALLNHFFGATTLAEKEIAA